MQSPRRITLLALAALLLAGCASTTLRNAWYDPTFTSGPFRKVIVVGVGSTLDTRRTFEEVFSQQLTAAGIQGIPGYQYLADDARQNEPAWNAGVAASGADAVMVVRLLGVDTRTQVWTTMSPGPAVWGPGWGPGWGWGAGPWGAVPMTEVSQYSIATVETTLYDVKTRRVVWAGSTETFNPRSVRQELPGFASLILGQLQARNLLPAKS